MIDQDEIICKTCKHLRDLDIKDEYFRVLCNIQSSKLQNINECGFYERITENTDPFEALMEINKKLLQKDMLIENLREENETLIVANKELRERIKQLEDEPKCKVCQGHGWGYE